MDPCFVNVMLKCCNFIFINCCMLERMDSYPNALKYRNDGGMLLKPLLLPSFNFVAPFYSVVILHWSCESVAY